MKLKPFVSLKGKPCKIKAKTVGRGEKPASLDEKGSVAYDVTKELLDVPGKSMRAIGKLCVDIKRPTE